MSERCDRCGSTGEDRRTLFMACFYQMSELGLPFTQLAIRGHVCKKIGEEPSALFPGSPLPIWDDPKGEDGNHPFYTLRVCKRCRAEWMEAIKGWFHKSPQGQDHDADEMEPGCGSGIFIREGGTIKEITEDEWKLRKVNSG